jgi:hypothetical protein
VASATATTRATPRGRGTTTAAATSHHHGTIIPSVRNKRERVRRTVRAARRAARPGPSPEAATPHEGYEVIAELLGRFDDPRDAFVFTSNIDGFFRRAGVPAEQLYEARAPGKDNSKKSERKRENRQPLERTTQGRKTKGRRRKSKETIVHKRKASRRRIARSSTPTRLRRRTRGAGFVAARRAMKGSAVLTGAVDRLN